MRRTIITAVVALALVIGALPNAAEAAASGWKIYAYNSSGRALSSKPAPAGDGSIAEFDFLPTPDDALLAMKATGGNRSLLGKTITATFVITGPATFTYYGEGTPDNPCGTPASVRFYFNSDGPFAFTNYWWSNPMAAPLVIGPEGGTLTATVEPDEWSDWNGQFGTTDPAAFAAAAMKPDLIGLSFGGGCFFENGVGTSTGSATFKLTSFEVH
jgi:hypothetical protein